MDIVFIQSERGERYVGLWSLIQSWAAFLHQRSELNSDKHHAITIYLVLGCN